MAVELLIADDHDVVRVGLACLFEGTSINVVAAAADGKEALALALEHRPHAALLDVRMPEMDGLECLSRMKTELAEMPIMMYSGYDNPTYIARSLALGAAGYLLKSVSRDQLVDAVLSMSRGESLWSRDDLRRVSGALGGRRGAVENDVPLTKRENEVLKQLAFGLTNKEIAQTLGISYETAKEHVQHVLKKLGVADRTQAAVWAVRNDLV